MMHSSFHTSINKKEYNEHEISACYTRSTDADRWGMKLFCSAASSFLAVAPTFAQECNAEVKERPNIILIYADDLGYSDISCYGHKHGNNFVETPNIDKLAEQGVSFTNAYASAPISSASRAGLLTGQYPARLGFEFVTSYEKNAVSWESDEWKAKFKGKKLLPPPLKMHLPLEETTMAEMLKNNGYQTAIVGKWHVASHVKRYKDWNPYYGPKQRGFDWTYDTYGSHPYGFPYMDKTKISTEPYPHDEVTAQAINFLKEEHQKPFFLYVSHYYVHTPIDMRSEELIEKYRKKSGGTETEEKIRYAAFVERFDRYVGQLLDAIDDEGLKENTIVIFTSDNGGDPIYAFNQPFRGSKWNLYEGGIRIPFIARWPSHIAPGTTNDQPIIQLDLMPTFYELCCSKNSYYEEAFDGISILPYLRAEQPKPRKDRSLLWHFPYYHPEGDSYDSAIEIIGKEDGAISQTKPHSAIRKGDYKLLYFYEDESSELYNIKMDPAESKDLSKEEKKIKKELEQELLDSLRGMKARFPRRQ